MNDRRVCTLLLLLALTGSPALAGDWPQFLGPNRDGVSDEKGLNLTWPSQGPPVLWQRDVGEGYSGPVVVGERLVLFHRVGNEDVVECLSATEGKSLWRFTYPTNYSDALGKGDGPRATPTVADGQVFVLSADGRLHCLDLMTGARQWSRDLATDYRPPPSFFGYGTSPLVEGKLVLVNAGGREAGIVALDRKTGKEVWKATNHEASYSSPVMATIDGKRLAVFFTREGLVVLDPETGSVRHSMRWRARIGASVNAATPLVRGNLVFLSASYRTGAILVRLLADRLEEVWKGDDILSNHFNTSVLQGDFLYGIDGRQEEGARLRCVEFMTGKVRWEKDRFGCSSMILADGNLILLTEAGDLVLVEATPTAYRERARVHVFDGICRAQLALANGLLYGHDGRKLVCWDLRHKG